jgi:hypothetical protein
MLPTMWPGVRWVGLGQSPALMPGQRHRIAAPLRQGANPDSARSMFKAALRISHRNGELPGLAYSSLGLACLAADLGDWHRAGDLHPAAQALLDPTGQRWEQGEARPRQEQFDRVYAHRTTLSLEQALDAAPRRTSVMRGL